MKAPKTLILLALILAFAFAHAGYYDSVINLTGQNLYLGLRTLISTNTYSNYDGAKVFLFQTLDNVNGYVKCIYTGYNYNVGYSYTGSTNPNTEHTYAQSWFSLPQTSIKKADLHHLFPSNSVVNSSRGNYPLFTVANHASANVYYNDTPWQSFRGNSNSGYTVFEPANQSKGNIARVLLYFNTRYNDPLTQQNVNMIPDLVAWHYQDLPDAAEIARNQAIFTFQSNRNPFIDHPEFVGRIWGGSSNEDITIPNPSPIVFRLVYPNPFSDKLSIVLDSQSKAAIELAVYNLRGERIRKLDIFDLSDGDSISWDGKNERGDSVPSGIYLIRAIQGDHQAIQKVLKSK
ncbi:MAG: endonuclease [Candidatus Cloacimonadaceae bacterium]|nr:endonuclease [Candidatus Cloacimonadaceae bacterium]MDP3113546.1 endonuclease [Candidatus Cloacimonadaceae bacterium]